MILTKGKKEFAINKAIELIKLCTNYEHTQMTMIRHFKWFFGRAEYVILHYNKDGNNWKVSKLEIKRNDSVLQIDYDNDTKILLDKFETEMMDMVKELDDKKFKKIFPEWDPIEDRDVKLRELLDQEPEPVKNKKKFGIF
jgi:hypothetical protein